jgi:hypothetical protein
MSIPTPKKEFRIRFKGNSGARFDQLVKETGGTEEQVFLNALRLYEEFIRLHKAGHKIYSDETGKIAQVNIFD